MTLLNPQGITVDGLNATYVAANAGGDSCVPGDRVFLHVKNSGGSSVTVTVVVPGSEYGQPRPDIPVTVAATGEEFIGPLVADLADPTTHDVGWTYSTATGVTVAVLNI